MAESEEEAEPGERARGQGFLGGGTGCERLLRAESGWLRSCEEAGGAEADDSRQRSFGERGAERTYTWQVHPRGRLLGLCQ